MKYHIFFVFLLSICLFSCETIKTKEEKVNWDFDKYMIEAQKSINNGDYYKAINLFNEAIIKYPDNDIIGINYNIGYCYYKLNKYEEAYNYFNAVNKLYNEKQWSEAEKMEYKKYVILANLITKKIEEDKKNREDPYHIREDLEANKTVRPKN